MEYGIEENPYNLISEFKKNAPHSSKIDWKQRGQELLLAQGRKSISNLTSNVIQCSAEWIFLDLISALSQG